MKDFRINSRTSLAGLVLFSSLAFVAGCGGGDQMETATVTGKVTQDGKAVTGGTITFYPKAEEGKPSGKPATGEVGSDGSYTLSTYANNDGAVVGMHEVSYSPPADEVAEPEEGGHSDTGSTQKELVPETKEVKVDTGSNTIDIKLVPGSN